MHKSVVLQSELVCGSTDPSANSASCSASSALKEPQQIFNAEYAEVHAETGEKNLNFKLMHYPQIS